MSARTTKVVRAAIAGACAEVDVVKADREPDAYLWMQLERSFVELLEAAYARNHDGKP